jgi:adenylate cyclase
VLVGLVLGYVFVLSKLSIPLRVTIFVLITGGYAVIAQLQFNYTGLMLQVAPYLAMFTGTFVGGIVYHAVQEGAERLRITRTFGQYVSPQVVAELVADPAKASLGGEKRVMTVMFSDIRGFTTMSEKLDPVDLVNFLNEYLTAMTDIIFARGGVVDKYMGDAIMAFWGAPIEQPDHAKRACLTAIDMLTKLREMQLEWKKRQLPNIDIGVGLNTGAMTVGNMGSKVRFDYTVMGDSVNLASRLEGINKEYGTNIVISEMTKKAIPEDVVTRELDLVAVKGKKEPVRIFELCAVVPTPALTERIEMFMNGLRMYRDRRFGEAKAAFEGVLAKYPDDGPSKTYIHRCDKLAEDPPPEVWDGVYVMKTK